MRAMISSSLSNTLAKNQVSRDLLRRRCFTTALTIPRCKVDRRQERALLLRQHSQNKSSITLNFQSTKRRHASLSSASNSYSFDSLLQTLPNVDFSTNPYELERHGRGESYHPVQRPNIIATPCTIEEVQEIVKHCVQHRIPIIPFGAGTSVEGHVTALHGGLSLDMTNFQTIISPEELVNDDITTTNNSLPDPVAIVGAGVTRKQLNEHLRATGLQFVVDPGADATLGGMFSTCASGTTTVKYGGMKHNILAATCVLPDETATIVHAGTRALKNSAGYDLLSLLCGSEGTLGIVTDVTVKLHPIPEHVVAAVCVFDSLHDAAQAVATIKLCDIPIVRCELLDETSVDAYNAYNQNNKNGKQNFKAMESKPTLFLEFEGSSELSLQEQVSQTQSICTDDFNGSSFQLATEENDRKALWSARHQLYYAAIASRPGATSAIVTDVCVPLSKFAHVLTETANDVKQAGVGFVAPCFGHAGDGNLHCILPTRDDDTEELRKQLHDIVERLTKRTLAVGGTCTGEHGVGYGKIKHLEKQYGPGAVHMMKLIKQGIDPHNIMNPGKVVPFF